MAVRRRISAAPPEWRNRIIEYATMTAAELAANPNNPRLHGDTQRKAMSSILDDVGWVVPIVVNRTTGLIVDGHMRVDLAADRGPIPVAYVELTDAEEREVLALMDPIGQMATYDPDAIATIMAGLETTVDLTDVFGPDEDDHTEVRAPVTVTLKPLQRAHVLVSVPLDQWDSISAILDQLEATPGVELHSTVN